MGLFPQCPARRFIDGSTDKFVEESSRVLLSAFFSSIGAKTVYLESGLSSEMRATVEKETGASLFGSFTGAERGTVEVLSAERAVGVCAERMTHVPLLPKASSGIAFGLDEVPDSPRNQWSLVLHRGPLLLLEMEVFAGATFKPRPGWAKPLIDSGSVHIVWQGDRGYVGHSDHVYLFLKRSSLFPYSKGSSSDLAIAAGLRLRQSCREVWSKGRGDENNPYVLSSWRRGQKRFIRKFDEMLVDHVGSRQLGEILRAMSTDLDQWLQASP